MGTAATAVKYTLKDGSVWTAVQLGEHLNLTATAARYRLNHSDNVKWVMRKQFQGGGRKKAHVCKKFNLDDGTALTAFECAKRFNVNISTMYARLSRGNRDVFRLSKKATQGSRSDLGFVDVLSESMEVVNMIKERNSIHPMGRLFLMMKGEVK